MALLYPDDEGVVVAEVMGEERDLPAGVEGADPGRGRRCCALFGCREGRSSNGVLDDRPAARAQVMVNVLYPPIASGLSVARAAPVS